MNIDAVTLGELMADDLYVWVKSHPKFGYNLKIENYDDEVIVDHEGIHPDAMESFASLCRTFLRAYDKCQEEL